MELTQSIELHEDQKRPVEKVIFDFLFGNIIRWMSGKTRPIPAARNIRYVPKTSQWRVAAMPCDFNQSTQRGIRAIQNAAGRAKSARPMVCVQ